LKITLNAFWAKHATIEGKIFPRLKSNHHVIFNFQLNATLLAAKTAMRFDQPIRLDTSLQPNTASSRQMRAEAGLNLFCIHRNVSHCPVSSSPQPHSLS